MRRLWFRFLLAYYGARLAYHRWRRRRLMAQNLSLVSPFSDPSDRFSPGSRVSFAFWRQPVYQLSDGTYWCPHCWGNTYADNPYDVLVLGDDKTPGRAIVRVSKEKEVDIKKRAGANYGALTLHGFKFGEVEIELLLWTPDQVRQFGLLWKKVFVKPETDALAAIVSPALTGIAGVAAATVGAAVAGAEQVAREKLAWPAWHPELARAGINALIFLRGDGIDVDDRGVGHFRIRAIEFARPGPTATQTPQNIAPISSQLDPGAVSTTSSGYALPSANTANLGPR